MLPVERSSCVLPGPCSPPALGGVGSGAVSIFGIAARRTYLPFLVRIERLGLVTGMSTHRTAFMSRNNHSRHCLYFHIDLEISSWSVCLVTAVMWL